MVISRWVGIGDDWDQSSSPDQPPPFRPQGHQVPDLLGPAQPGHNVPRPGPLHRQLPLCLPDRLPDPGLPFGSFLSFAVPIPISLVCLSVGMYRLELRDRVRDGYTPATSMSRYETDVLKEFLGSSGDPLLTTVMLRARDGRSLHRLRWLDECVQLHNFLRRNISAHLETEVIERIEPTAAEGANSNEDQGKMSED